MCAAPPDETASFAGWDIIPYDATRGRNWTHVLLSSPLARCSILDPHHARVYGKGRHNFSGLLSRLRLKVEDSGCSVPLYAAELGGSLVLYGGKTGRELALELRREAGSVSVHAYDECGRALELMRSSFPAGHAVLAVTRREHTFSCFVNGELVWRGSLPFSLPPARVLLRALGDSAVAEGREKSAVFGPVRVRGAMEEKVLSGRVVGPSGEPVAGAWVHTAADPFSGALTDSGGRFQLSLAPTGSDLIIAGAEGYDFASRWIGEPGGSDLLIQLPPARIPRPEYPRPEFDRSHHWWLNLNGLWRFALDPQDVGAAEGWERLDAPYQAVIRVPFPWTSLLGAGEEELAADHRYTGVWAGYTGTAWYKRRVRIPQDAPSGAVGVLKFLAVNAFTDVYWDGKLIASHDGGFDPFECAIGELVPGSTHDLAVRVHYPAAIDPTDILVGKQGWWFTHAPGIWQTAWIEARSPAAHITRFHVRGDVTFRKAPHGEAASRGEIEAAAFHIDIAARGAADAVEISVYDPQGNLVGRRSEPVVPLKSPEGGASGAVQAAIPVGEPALWDIDSPNLYILRARLLAKGEEVDSVSTYSGLRQIRTGPAPCLDQDQRTPSPAPYSYVYLNDRPVYLIGILDQAYNPWGVYTYRALGPKDLAGSIQNDLDIAKRLGYNLIRLHIKTNEPLWLYEAAKAGILVWDELPNFRGTPESAGWQRLAKMLEAVHERDFNCPAIVIRSIINESWGAEDMRTNPATQAKIRELVARQRTLEPHRLVVDNSAAQGYPNRHIDTDINDEHIYLSDWWDWKRRLAQAQAQIFPGSAYNFHSGTHEPDEAGDYRQSGQPYVISEFSSHGRKALAIRMFPKIAGFVKIDLVDQEWERFTPYTYTRTPKPPRYFDADFNPIGEEMEHSLDAVVIDAPPENHLAPGTRTSVPIAVAAFHRALQDVPPVLHLRCVARTGGAPAEGGPQQGRVIYEESVPLSIRPFTVETVREALVCCPPEADEVYLFAWLTRGGAVTARDMTHWRSRGTTSRT